MEFYSLCRSIRNQCQKAGNKEIELQILGQLYSAYFLNNDKMPNNIVFNLNLKPILKGSELSKYDRETLHAVYEYKSKCTDLQEKTRYYIYRILTKKLAILSDLGISYDPYNITYQSAWEYSVGVKITQGD